VFVVHPLKRIISKAGLSESEEMTAIRGSWPFTGSNSGLLRSWGELIELRDSQNGDSEI
jgi:hypothetical protein